MSQQFPFDDLRALAKQTDLDPAEDTGGSNTVGSSLDHLIGKWSQKEADEMDTALNDFETVDGIAWTRVTAG